MATIILCGGGTAGHIMPHIALLSRFRAHFSEVLYIGTEHGMERGLCARYNVPFEAVPAVKLRRSLSPKNLLIPVRLMQGVKAAEKILKAHNPAVVFSKGGYAALPVVLAAKRLKIPVVAHESDRTPGLVTKLTCKHAHAVCCSFSDCVPLLKGKGVHTGSPVREELLRGSAVRAQEWYGLRKAMPVLLVTGGSSGALALNAALRGSLDALLPHMNIIHLTGRGKADDKLKKDGYVQIEFTPDLADIFALADAAVSRAGSNTLFELAALGLPMLLVPLPKSRSSRGDQVDNAAYFERLHCAHVLPQETLSETTLTDAVMNLFDKRHLLKAALSDEDFSGGNARVMQVIVEAATSNDTP